MALFAAISFLLADALAETHAAGAPGRWWLTAIVVLHALAVAALWRRTTWTERTRLSVVTFAAALAVTAWLPEGLSNGIRLATLSTSTVLCLSAAAACVWAALTAARVRRWPLPVAAVVLALGAYAALAFGLAALRGEPFHALLADGSFWRALPHVLHGAVVGAVVVLPLGLLASIVGIGLRWPDPRTRAAQAYRAVTIALLGALVLPGVAPRGVPDTQVAAAAGGRPSPLTPQQRLAALDIGLKSLEDADRGALRDRWDPEYLAQRFTPDPQLIYDWVRQNTIWVPYRGVLRGPAGVLMDRLGNSLDRSLLLADLLKRTGRTVRLARGELSRDAALTQLARRLTETAAAADQEEPAAGDLASDISDLSREYQVDPAAVTGSLLQPAEALASAFVELDRRSSEQSARLLAAVPRPDVRAEWRARFESALRAIQDHWWVQLRDEDRWLDLDLFHDGARFGGSAATAGETFEVNDLPASLYHDVVIRIVTARQRPGSTARGLVLEHALRPLDVLGQQVTIQFLPTRWPEPAPESPAALRTAFLQQEDWAAALVVGDKVATEAAFDVRGDRQASSGGFGGLGAGSASIFGQAGGQPMQLTGTWFEFEFRRPGEAPTTVRREVFDFTDRGGAPLDEGARLARSLALMGRTEILPFGWEFAPDYVSHLAVRSLLENRPALEAAAGAVDPASVPTGGVPARVTPPVSPLYMIALARFEWSRVGRYVFNDRINLLARHTVLLADADGISARSVTDIVANEVGVGLDARDGFAVRVEQGVTDTNAEALLGFGKPLAGNTADAYAGATGWTTLRSAADAEGIQLGSAAKRHLAADLEAGRLAVAPRAPVATAAGTFSGWWRVDPATGDTLGIASNGRGQAVTLLVALQSSGETSVHYNVMTEMAKGFIFEEAFCRAAPYAFVASRPIWMFYINSLAPEWWIRTLPPAAPDVPTAVESGRNMCIFALMAGGVLATLPLVMMTLRFATLGHIAVDGAANLRRAGRPGRWGRGPARQRGNGAGGPGSSSAPTPPSPRGGGGRGSVPEQECPGGGGNWGRGRTDDGFGNYPPNSPPRPGEYAHNPGPGWTSRDPAEVEDLIQNARRVQGEAQNAFDEALARYREAARQVDATSGEPSISKERTDALLAEQQAEAGLQNARAELWRSKQRVAHWEEVKPAAERVRATERAVQDALGRAPASGANDAWLEEYLAATRQAGAARDEYLEISSRPLSDYPGSATPSPGGGAPAPGTGAAPGGAAPGGAAPGGGAPAPGPGGTMPMGCGGGGAAPGGAAGASGGSSGSGAAGGLGASSGGVDPFGATQQDLGKTMPGAPPATIPQPTTSTAPGMSQTSGRAVLGLGVIVGGTGG